MGPRLIDIYGNKPGYELYKLPKVSFISYSATNMRVAIQLQQQFFQGFIVVTVLTGQPVPKIVTGPKILTTI